MYETCRNEKEKKCVLRKEITVRQAMESLTNLEKQIVAELKTPREDDAVLAAVEALAPAEWIGSEEGARTAVAAVATLHENVPFMDLNDAMLDIQQLIKITQEDEKHKKTIFAAVEEKSWKEPAAGSKFWSMICAGSGPFADICEARPVLRSLAQLLLTISRCSCSIERCFSGMRLAAPHEKSAWTPLGLFRQLVLQRETCPGGVADVDARAIEIYKLTHREHRSWKEIAKRKKHNQPKRKEQQHEAYDDFEVTDATGLLRMMKSELEGEAAARAPEEAESEEDDEEDDGDEEEEWSSAED